VSLLSDLEISFFSDNEQYLTNSFLEINYVFHSLIVIDLLLETVAKIKLGIVKNKSTYGILLILVIIILHEDGVLSEWQFFLGHLVLVFVIVIIMNYNHWDNQLLFIDGNLFG